MIFSSSFSFKVQVSHLYSRMDNNSDLYKLNFMVNLFLYFAISYLVWSWLKLIVKLDVHFLMTIIFNGWNEIFESFNIFEHNAVHYYTYMFINIYTIQHSFTFFFAYFHSIFIWCWYTLITAIRSMSSANLRLFISIPLTNSRFGLM